MPENEPVESVNSAARQRPQQIASWGWLIGFLLIGAGVVTMGFLAQHAPPHGGGAAPTQLASHSQAIPIYLTAIFMDWALLYYCWAGVHRKGGNLQTLSGGRWTSWKDVLTDIAIVLPFWVLWEAAAYGVHWLLTQPFLNPGGVESAKTVASLLPKSPLEILIWVATSTTAGICEEMAFRGFLQRQFHALTGNLALAVVLQGVVFGLFHAYQGWTNVIVISVLGSLYGVLAAWRGNLRANIIAHAWTDVWEGWFKFLVLR